ncbi:MAG: PAS domain S-box protein, partial [Pseudomonadota bacterium]
MAKGNYDIDLTNTAMDETGDMLNALDIMRSKIQEVQIVLRETLEQSIDAVVSIDEENKITFFNTAAENLWGFKKEEIVGENASVLLPDAINPGDKNTTDIDKVVGRAHEVQISIKSGEQLWTKISMSQVKASGKTLYTAFANDITDAVNAREQFKILSLVADETDNSVVITNKQGLIEYVNPGFSRLTGYSSEESMGKKPGHLLQGEHTDADTVARIREKLSKREPFYDEILNYDNEGKPYWISLAINPVFDANGELERFISIQANITETKETSVESAYRLSAIDRSNTILELDLDANILRKAPLQRPV